ncbi:MAG: S46 family peptidase [Pseudomonadota bacterium]
MRRFIALALPALLTFPAFADEGMWTFDAPPTVQVKEKYGFELTQPWLDHVRLSSVRLAGGCSGSFISPDGLVMTNHHCSHECIEQLSTAAKDFVAAGFHAKTAADEHRCPDMEVDQLLAITDVTDRIQAATRGLAGEKFDAALKAEKSKIEKRCAGTARERCDVVTLFQGGKYDLYKYRRFQDVRLVFAPEVAIAFFGGDPDNFMFPRYDLDVSLLRVYENGKPAVTPDYFKWSPAGAGEGELTFVTGNPGNTSRLLTVAQLQFERDARLLSRLLYLAELRGTLTEFQNRGTEQKRISTATRYFTENSFKAIKGYHEALADPDFFGRTIAAENELKAKITAKPELKNTVGNAFDEIEKATAALRKIYPRLVFIEGYPREFQKPQGFPSPLFRIARLLVRASDELSKPNEKRLREFSVSNLPALEEELFSSAPIYDEFEIEMLTFSLTKLREVLGPDDPFVRRVLMKESPSEVARSLVSGTKLKDAAFRRKLYKASRATMAASTDPMIRFVRMIDPDSRKVRKEYEEQIDSVVTKAGERIAKARFGVNGTNTYPDATFTLRLSYGQVKGYEENGHKVSPITRIVGAFNRHTGRDPFALPPSWLAAESRLDLNTPLNFCTTNDIIGGNSGSPVINRNAEIVGLIFDGNIQSLGGDYAFDESVNRAVAVSSQGLLESLSKVYGAGRIVGEIRDSSKTAPPKKL